jgi:hypothetical protein
MNLYIGAVGFSEMDSRQERKLIKTIVKQYTEQGLVLKNETFSRGIIIARVSDSTGIYIFGRYEGKKFIYEYHYPFLVGSRYTDNDELLVERHVDKESYSVICDESRTGVTLIFFLQNVFDYMNYICSGKDFKKEDFNPDRRNLAAKNSIKGYKVVLSALSLGGMILLPMHKPEKLSKREADALNRRKKLIEAAKEGDEDAIEHLTIDDIDTYTRISHRILNEDVFSIVDSTFMPCGVECDQYSVIGEIIELSEEQNVYTGEKIYVMTLECNNMIFTMAVNSVNLLGEPKVGRRFKGQVWLQGSIKFS